MSQCLGLWCSFREFSFREFGFLILLSRVLTLLSRENWESEFSDWQCRFLIFVNQIMICRLWMKKFGYVQYSPFPSLTPVSESFWIWSLENLLCLFFFRLSLQFFCSCFRLSHFISICAGCQDMTPDPPRSLRCGSPRTGNIQRRQCDSNTGLAIPTSPTRFSTPEWIHHGRSEASQRQFLRCRLKRSTFLIIFEFSHCQNHNIRPQDRHTTLR